MDLFRVSLKDATRALRDKISTVNSFFRDVILPLAARGEECTPERIFRTATHSEIASSVTASTNIQSEKQRRINHAHDFLQWVVLNRLSELDDSGTPVAAPGIRNPLRRLQGTDNSKGESIYSALPYGYISDIRNFIAEGPNFSDWKRAQELLGGEQGWKAGFTPDWYAVDPRLIDKSDPDCVWRVRNYSDSTSPLGFRTDTEMWSPVRHVAVLVKLILPLRTFQVRFLDSGESDTYVYRWSQQGAVWVVNNAPIAEGTQRKPVQRGVFRREALPGTAPNVQIYVNTNKTADALLSGNDKGYCFPWYADPDLTANPLYWLAKLRDWQIKYHPSSRTVKWDEIPTHILRDIKSDFQLAKYPPATFLFRDPAAEVKFAPISDFAVTSTWNKYLKQFENHIAALGRFNPDGSRILLTFDEDRRASRFPLHSLRVSLITALGIEGRLPFELLQKITGHSRMIMVMYYSKANAEFMSEQLKGALDRLGETKEASICRFLSNARSDQLVEALVCNDPTSMLSSIKASAFERSPAGWMPMHNGFCLMGGNAAPIPGKSTVGGCHNGGLAPPGSAIHGPVPGGPKNCIRCRWFATAAPYLMALVAQFNNLLYHFYEAEKKCVRTERELNSIRDQRYAIEAKGKRFEDAKSLQQLERQFEFAMQEWSLLAENLDASSGLIERCRKQLRINEENGGAQRALVALGDADDIRTAIETTDSELLQLAGVCDDLEFYPELRSGAAIVRRSQLLDAALEREGKPPLFLHLSEEEQLSLGNRMMKSMASQVDHAFPEVGRRKVVAVIDAGQALTSLGINVGDHTSGAPIKAISLTPRLQNEVIKE